ncbi:hypothetical protein E2C01_037989 [Portunus trituberculatus]|uniref:Uncharacterized protein n=1 Tax=Portunus trituberculatus TaxID=210409 RepID=A0A5B7FFL1_PORTR|nr:hypothetical protein [Portunus trituberculatus]
MPSGVLRASIHPITPHASRSSAVVGSFTPASPSASLLLAAITPCVSSTPATSLSTVGECRCCHSGVERCRPATPLTNP